MGKLKKAVANGSRHGPWRENTYRLLGDDGELPWLNSLLGELPGRVPLQNWPQVEQKRVRARDLETIQMEQETDWKIARCRQTSGTGGTPGKISVNFRVRRKPSLDLM